MLTSSIRHSANALSPRTFGFGVARGMEGTSPRFDAFHEEVRRRNRRKNYRQVGRRFPRRKKRLCRGLRSGELPLREVQVPPRACDRIFHTTVTWTVTCPSASSSGLCRTLGQRKHTQVQAERKSASWFAS